MLKTICPTVLLLLATACGGVVDAAGHRIDGDGDGEDADGEPSDPPYDGEDGSGDEPEPDAGTGGTDDAGSGEIEGANILVAKNAKFDGYFTDAEGRALYMRVTDAAGSGSTTCVDAACKNEWPPFDVEMPLAGRGLDQNDFARLHRLDGAFQVTYKGRPLYYRKGDTAGDVTGDGLDENNLVATDGTARFYVARDYTAFLYIDKNVKPAGTQLFAIPFLVDMLGHTLYVYLTDTQGQTGTAPTSSCLSEDCRTKWPVWTPALEHMILPTGIAVDTVTEFDRETGEKQAAFRGWPLYFYNQDDSPGEASGHNVGEWRAIDPAHFATGSSAPVK